MHAQVEKDWIEEAEAEKFLNKNRHSKYLRCNLIEDGFLSYNVEEMNFLSTFLLIQKKSEHRRHAVSQTRKKKHKRK